MVSEREWPVNQSGQWGVVVSERVVSESEWSVGSGGQ